MSRFALMLVVVVSSLTAPVFGSDSAAALSLDDCNVVWETPSEGCLGSMPLGNGNIGLNVWVEATGDVLFYISKTDAWSGNNRLLKVGKVRVRLSPNPFAPGGTFRQELDLTEGRIVVDGEVEGQAVQVRVWVDAHHPVVHVEADGAAPVEVTASIEPWRLEKTELPSIEISDSLYRRGRPENKHAPTVVEPDVVFPTIPGMATAVGWYHHNTKSIGPALSMEFQDLADAPYQDPLLHRTFGAVVRAANGTRVDSMRVASPRGKSHRVDVFVLTRHPASPSQWLRAMTETVRAVDRVPLESRLNAHRQWWRSFWDRSRILIRDRKDAAGERVVPKNELPLVAGKDQGGANAFGGAIDRVSVLATALKPEGVRGLATSGRERLTVPKVAGSWVDVGAGDVLDVPESVFAGSFTVEAWIRPEKRSGGARIVDKITPGGSDGFLLDILPGQGLRVIAGPRVLIARPEPASGRWHHVAAVVDTAAQRIEIYLNGEKALGEVLASGPPAFDVTRGYNLQRFIDACGGRGAYPIKFNGAIFNVAWPGKPGDADYRRWGPGYWWQNTRLPYLSMCAAGDFDLMQPFIEMYAGEFFEVCKYRTKRYFNHGGAYFPECVFPWGAVFMESYGWDKPAAEREDKLQVSGWHKWEWVSGLEFAWMLFDYYEHTLDEAFLRETMLPVAIETMRFFAEHYETGSDGKLVMRPSQSLETWWNTTAPMPEVAGLHALTARVLALPASLTSDRQRSFCKALAKKLPALPTRELDGKQMYAPAGVFESKRNIENPELYVVFPFRLCSFEKDNVDLGVRALEHRWDRGHFGWRQDDVFMAYLGLASQAKDNVVRRSRMGDRNCRFPAFWGPNYDWTPDQDHGGILMKAVQSMLLQTEGRRVFLLPAWPEEWDVDFKLHAPYQTVVEGRVRGGKLESWSITPKSRRDDVVVLEPQ